MDGINQQNEKGKEDSIRKIVEQAIPDEPEKLKIDEVTVEFMKNILIGKIDVMIKNVSAGRCSGTVYVPLKYKGKRAIVLIAE